jgi:hypothetical protein
MIFFAARPRAPLTQVLMALGSDSCVQNKQFRGEGRINAFVPTLVVL